MPAAPGPSVRGQCVVRPQILRTRRGMQAASKGGRAGGGAPGIVAGYTDAGMHPAGCRVVPLPGMGGQRARGGFILFRDGGTPGGMAAGRPVSPDKRKVC